MASNPLAGNRRRSRWKWVVIGLGALAAAVVAFYQVEDWRGRRAWEACRRELAAKGETVDWAAFVPPALPPESNILQAPMMNQWFGGVFNSAGRTSVASPIGPDPVAKPFPVAQLTVLPLSQATNIKASDADIILRFISPGGAAFLVTNTAHITNADAVSIVEMDDVPFVDAIKTLALQAGLRITFDPTLGPQPNFTLKWKNLTAKEALLAGLNRDDLRMEPAPDGSWRVEHKPPNDLKTLMPDNATRVTVGELRQRLIGPTKMSPVGSLLLRRRMDETQLARVILITYQDWWYPNDSDAFFREYLVGPGMHANTVHIHALDSSHFNVEATDVFAAEDYLKWSRAFETNMDIIRAALARPAAQWDYYQDPMRAKVDFTNFRRIAQVLATEAQCDMLLDRPADA